MHACCLPFPPDDTEPFVSLSEKLLTANELLATRSFGEEGGMQEAIHECGDREAACVETRMSAVKETEDLSECVCRQRMGACEQLSNGHVDLEGRRMP